MYQVIITCLDVSIPSHSSSSLSLENILEGDYPLPLKPSPSHSLLSSTSNEASPFPSRGSSPPPQGPWADGESANLGRRFSEPLTLEDSLEIDTEGSTKRSLDSTRLEDISRLSLQRSSALLSKVKSETIQKTGRMVKGLLYASLSPVPAEAIQSFPEPLPQAESPELGERAATSTGSSLNSSLMSPPPSTLSPPTDVLSPPTDALSPPTNAFVIDPGTEAFIAATKQAM